MMARTRLNKLRKMNRREFRARGKQEISKIAERFLSFSKEMSDVAFLRSIDPAYRRRSPLETAAAIVDRIRQSLQPAADCRTFFPSLTFRSRIIGFMGERFAPERQAAIRRADRALIGRFGLLGLDDIGYHNKIDWRLDPVSGKRTPLAHWSKIDYLNPEQAGDKKITWELNRHGHFTALGQAYWLTADERYARAFVSQASSWSSANPLNRGINWASSLEIALRSISWLWALHFFAGSTALTPEFSLRFLKQLIAHGKHIETYSSDYFSPNTHLTGEALGLFYLGTALPEFRQASAWKKIGADILSEQFQLQVRDDGVYFEQATYYHRYTADFYIHLAVLARANGLQLPMAIEQRLADMLDHLMWITRPDGFSPLIGDDDGGRLVNLGEPRKNDFRDTLALGAVLFGRPDWKWVAGSAPVEMLWLLGPQYIAAYDEIQAKAPTRQSRSFDAGGYYVMRDGWDRESSYALIDCGPHGALTCGHAHADALAFEYAALGKTWLIDPGTFTYTGDAKQRDEFRSTAAHNTVTVDGESQSVPDGMFSWNHVARTTPIDFVPAEGLVYFKGSHDGYERFRDPVTHSRSLAFVKSNDDSQSEPRSPGYLAVYDSFIARDRHRYTIRYHLSPGCTAVAAGNQVLIAEPEGRRLSITVFSQTMPQARIAETSVSSCYGKRETALVAEFEVEACGPQEFTTFVLPFRKRRWTLIPGEQEINSPARGFLIGSGEVLDVILTGSGSETIRCGPLAAAGSLTWARFVKEKLVRACLIRGQLLKTNDGFMFSSGSLLKSCSIKRNSDRTEIQREDRREII